MDRLVLHYRVGSMNYDTTELTKKWLYWFSRDDISRFIRAEYIGWFSMDMWETFDLPEAK